MRRRGVGASVLRKEDDRLMRGRGQFVADINMRGTHEVVFLRSPHAHAHIRSITVPPGARGKVFTAADLPRIKPIQVVTQAAGAHGHRHGRRSRPARCADVGEAIAACVAATRAEAEDLAASVAVDYAPLPAVVDAIAARAGGPRACTSISATTCSAGTHFDRGRHRRRHPRRRKSPSPANTA